MPHDLLLHKTFILDRDFLSFLEVLIDYVHLGVVVTHLALQGRGLVTRVVVIDLVRLPKVVLIVRFAPLVLRVRSQTLTRFSRFLLPSHLPDFPLGISEPLTGAAMVPLVLARLPNVLVPVLEHVHNTFVAEPAERVLVASPVTRLIAAAIADAVVYAIVSALLRYFPYFYHSH